MCWQGWPRGTRKEGSSLEKIKVLNIISDSNIGGAGRCLVTFFKTYDRQRFDASALVPQGSKLKAQLLDAGARVLEYACEGDKSFSLRAVFAISDIIRRERPQVVHTHGAMSARIAARLSGGAKIVYTRHSVFEPSRLMKSIPGRIFGRVVSGLFSDIIIAVADAAKKNLTDTGVPDGKVKVILNGIEPVKRLSDRENLEYRRKLGIPRQSMVVSIVARLEEVKGHSYFVEAAERVIKRGVDAVFVIAGTGSMEDRLKREVKSRGLEGKVIFTGFLPDVTGLYNITHIVVNASYGTEATSLSLLEGMSLGKPAVVTDYGGNPGVISDGVNGIIVPERDGAALGGAILRLLEDNNLYARLSDGAREVFGRRFTAQAMTREIENVYSGLVKERRSV